MYDEILNKTPWWLQEIMQLFLLISFKYDDKARCSPNA